MEVCFHLMICPFKLNTSTNLILAPVPGQWSYSWISNYLTRVTDSTDNYCCLLQDREPSSLLWSQIWHDNNAETEMRIIEALTQLTLKPWQYRIKHIKLYLLSSVNKLVLLLTYRDLKKTLILEENHLSATYFVAILGISQVMCHTLFLIYIFEKFRRINFA